jgi:hypothetical protein
MFSSEKSFLSDEKPLFILGLVYYRFFASAMFFIVRGPDFRANIHEHIAPKSGK